VTAAALAGPRGTSGGPADRLPSLRRRVLPRWAPAASAGAALVVALALNAAGALDGVVRVAALFAVLYAVVLTLLSRAVEGRRCSTDRLATTLVSGAFLLALVPLVSVLWTVVSRGVRRFDLTFFQRSNAGITARDPGGGAYHAIIGTLEQVGLATLIAVPLALLTAVYLVEYGRWPLATAVSYVVDVMTGLPSVVAGLFVLAFWVLALGQGFSGFAGSLALAVLMLPIVSRNTEEMLKLVPDDLREASYALGVPRWRTILGVVLPTALPGIVTGMMLGVARIFGETAPVLLVVFGNNVINNNPFDKAQASLPLYVFQQVTSGNRTAIDRAWTAALTLIIIVMLLNLVARLVSRRSTVGR